MRLPSFRLISAALPALTLLLVACSAEVNSQHTPSGPTATGSSGGNAAASGGAGMGGNGATTGGTVSQALSIGPTTVRRLTNTEYRNSVQKLLALGAAPTETLESAAILKGFDNFSATLTVNGALAGEYAAIAKTRAKDFAVPPCAAPATEESCARSFIESFGKQAFRRPLTSADVDGYLALFSDEKTRTGYTGGITQIVETMLQSGLFLYRSELGVEAQGPTRHLTSYEVATLLAYMFTAKPPDDALFIAADADALKTPIQVEEQVRRLMKTPDARPAIRQFMRVFSGTARFGDVRKNADTFPQFTASVQASMGLETDAFVDSVVWDGDGTLNSLYTSPDSFINSDLAPLYGLPDPGQGPKLMPTHLNAKERAGLVTQLSILSTHSKAYDSFPILRGKFVRVTLLCEVLPPMPADAKITPPPQDPSFTTRERFAAHSQNPTCATCHRLIDPVGFGLENYDGIGRYRTTENNKPVDASGNITDSPDMNGAYSGGVELASKLTQSQEAKQCLALQALKWSLGREEVAGERELVNGIAANLAAGGLDIREVLVNIAKSDNFVARSYQ